jgi:SNF2 family DNA or RNA helicase
VDFQSSSSPCRFFVGQVRTGGYGLTLTAASTVIYYSNSYDLEVRMQSEDRAHRIGQTNKVTYVDLVAENTVDEKIVKALKNKINLANAVMGDAWREWIT